MKLKQFKLKSISTTNYFFFSGYNLNMDSKTPEWFQKALKKKPKSHYHKGKNYSIHYLFWACQQKAEGSIFFYTVALLMPIGMTLLHPY